MNETRSYLKMQRRAFILVAAAAAFMGTAALIFLMAAA